MTRRPAGTSQVPGWPRAGYAWRWKAASRLSWRMAAALGRVPGHEALATGADPLHLTLVFNIDHTNAMAYADAARSLLSGPAERALLPGARNQPAQAGRDKLPHSSRS